MPAALEIILIPSFFVKTTNVGIDCNGFEYISLCYLRFSFDVLRNLFINSNLFNNGYHDYSPAAEAEKPAAPEAAEASQETVVEAPAPAVETSAPPAECSVPATEESKDVKVEAVEIPVDIKEDVAPAGKVLLLISGIRKVGVVSTLSLVIIIEFNYFRSACWSKINRFFVSMR